jgi:hypothetical protein
MATKRELMLAGFAAKAAHMLASDQLNPAQTVTPGGTDQGSATLLLKNVALVEPTANGQGVRMPPATGQFIHVLRNVSGQFSFLAYPDGEEAFNVHGPGVPWEVGAAMTAFFFPTRQMWLVGAAFGDERLGQDLPGPVAIGIPTPIDAYTGQLFVGDVLSIGLGVRPNITPPTPQGRFCFNAFYDANGTWRYLGNGPAFMLRCDQTSGAIIFEFAPAGSADQPIPPWVPIPGQPLAVMSPNALQIGAGGWPPADAAYGSFFSNYICIPWSVGVGGASASRINFNCYFDSGMVLRYAANGPAYRLVFPNAGGAPTAGGNSGMHVRAAPAGTADQPCTFTEFFGALSADQITDGQTNVLLTTNEAGTLTYQQVLIGPANSGPGGTGRALYVAT